MLVKSILDRENLQNMSLETIAYLSNLELLARDNEEIAVAVRKELHDQRNSLKLIASENYSSIGVQLAMGNFLTDKYAEGHPFHRFYAGCDNIDTIESLACELAKKIFNVEHAYVQPHSGADANLIAYWSILIKRIETPYVELKGKKNVAQLTAEEYEEVRGEFSKQKMLGMSLDSGGHLTHGSRANFSSKMMEAIGYGVDSKTGLIDYEALEEQALREKPLILIAGYSSYSRLIDFERMRQIADRSGATLLVDMAHFAGLVAGKQLVGKYSPVGYADIITSTTHKTLRGPRGGLILCTSEYAPYVNKGCPYAIGGPLPHVIAAKACAFKECLDESFQGYAKQVIVNAKTLSDRLKENGATIISGGTDNHLLVVDIETSYGITGRAAEILLARCKITVNRNSIPLDPNGPWYTSGIRIGTPALTTRNMKEGEMVKIADIIHALLKEAKPCVNEVTNKVSKASVTIDEKVTEKAILDVEELLSKFSLYPEITI